MKYSVSAVVLALVLGGAMMVPAAQMAYADDSDVSDEVSSDETASSDNVAPDDEIKLDVVDDAPETGGEQNPEVVSIAVDDPQIYQTFGGVSGGPEVQRTEPETVKIIEQQTGYADGESLWEKIKKKKRALQSN
jgi:hypothetical protein